MAYPDRIQVKSIHNVIHFSLKRTPGQTIEYNGNLPHFELIYRIKGEVVTEFDGYRLVNSEGTLQILPKSSHNPEYIVTTIVPGTCIDILFDTDSPFFTHPSCLDLKGNAEIHRLFLEISRIWLKKDTGYYYEAMSCLYKILALISQHDISSSKYHPHYKKIKASVDYLNENFYLKDIDYSEISKLSDMSYSYFRRLFEECMGIPPAKYVADKRINYAKELLKSDLYMIHEVADAVGYNDVYYFSRCFKAVTGCSPSEYRSGN